MLPLFLTDPASQAFSFIYLFYVYIHFDLFTVVDIEDVFFLALRYATRLYFLVNT